MARPKQLTPNAHLHITIDAKLRERLDQAVWSDLEGRIPAGGLQRFIEARLQEYFSDERVDLGALVLGAGVVSGSPATIAALIKHLEEQ
ncbi:MAG: hypothetical protein IPO00_09745 [Betaproteobacteria bacterium]|jgi:hypothetical protein|nr:hypothetical protein [Betaproteobacteria bacterium]